MQANKSGKNNIFAGVLITNVGADKLKSEGSILVSGSLLRTITSEGCRV